MSQLKRNSLKSDKLNVGSLNVRGMNDNLKRKSIKKDLDQYDLNILVLQETKTKGTIIEKITTEKGNTSDFFQSNSDKNKYYGTALIINSTLSPEFKAISDRMCMATLETNKLIVIATTHAPTEQRSNDHPEEQGKCYCELEQIVNKIPNRDVAVIAGDFNARVGKKTENSAEVIGNNAKGKDTSENGQLIQIVLQKRPNSYQHNFQTLSGARNNLDIKPKTNINKNKPVPKSDRLHYNQGKKH